MLECFSLMHPLRVARASGDLETRYCVPSQLPDEQPLEAIRR